MNIGLIGNGRFGQLFAKEMSPYFNLKIWDKDTNRCTYSLGAVLNQDFVVLAVPMRELDWTCRHIAPFLHPGQTIIDVCSLKVYARNVMLSTLPEFVRIVGTHPLFGPQSVKNGLTDQKIAVCSIRGGSASDIVSFCSVKLGLKVYEVTPEEHDRQMAISQAVTHFIGRIAERMNLDRIELGTKSYDDLVDIIRLVRGGSPELFGDMQTLNPFAEEIRDLFLETARKLDEDIKAGKF